MKIKKRLPHLTLGNDSYSEEFFTSNRQRGAEKRIPPRDRFMHAEFLKKKFLKAWEEGEREILQFQVQRNGIYIEFKGEPGYDLITKSLEDLKSNKIRLCNIRTESEFVHNDDTGEEEKKSVIYATVFVSNDKKNFFLKKLIDYAEKESKSNNPKNADLINGISDLCKALLVESFWLDDCNLIPEDDPEWIEVWLSSQNKHIIERFDNLLAQIQITSSKGILLFPERAVKIIFANRAQLENLSRHSDDIAEYRKAKDTADFFTGLKPEEQAEWVDSLVKRLQVDQDSIVSVCILDTGVNCGHKLLAPVLKNSDCHTVRDEWKTHDHDGHGTLMAGTATYGDLLEILKGNEIHKQKHLLESVKILPDKDKNSSELWGDITQQGISRAEISEPQRKRIICMAITCDDTRDRGRPTSWSAALDQVISGAEEENRERRFVIISSGNISDQNQYGDYPNSQINDSIHDPGQAWNALTVGSFTKLDSITDPTFSGYKPLAPRNGLSPFTTTSLTWEDKWPIKPEIVMEGGNLGKDENGFISECADLSILSTYYKPSDRQFEYINMTSASTAQAAWLAAQIQVRYPEYWPETIRALMIHSSEWSETLKDQFLKNSSNKTDRKKLLRICGYGIPNLDRALYSASNSLTLISQAELQPFEHKGNRNHTKDMHFYELPWPKDILLHLPAKTKVKMRITLSYFIEPGPGEMGWKDRYRYASFALRFDVNSPEETKEEFVKRINVAARMEDEVHPGTRSSADHWFLGAHARDKGSIHSDIWEGSAQELATSNLIAISPMIGWWRERSHLGKCERKTRYSLVVSISIPEQEIDIYTPVAKMITPSIPIPIKD